MEAWGEGDGSPARPWDRAWGRSLAQVPVLVLGQGSPVLLLLVVLVLSWKPVSGDGRQRARSVAEEGSPRAELCLWQVSQVVKAGQVLLSPAHPSSATSPPHETVRGGAAAVGARGNRVPGVLAADAAFLPPSWAGSRMGSGQGTLGEWCGGPAFQWGPRAGHRDGAGGAVTGRCRTPVFPSAVVLACSCSPRLLVTIFLWSLLLPNNRQRR